MIDVSYYNPATRLVHFYDDQRNLIGRYDIRGGICWPTVVEEYGSAAFRGFAVVCGRNIEDSIIKVLDQFSFSTVESVLSHDEGIIEHRGLTDWINECSNKWRNERYYWRQTNDTDKDYLLQIIRSKTIGTLRPVLPKIDWSDTNSAKHMVLKLVETADLQIKASTDLAQDIATISPATEKLSPPLHALVCCLTALERYPWRKNKNHNEADFVPSRAFVRHFPGVNHGT